MAPGPMDRAEAPTCGLLLFLFLEDADAVAAHRHRNPDHGLEELDGDLFFRLVNLHHPGLLALEWPGDEFDDVAFHDPADDWLRRQVGLDLGEGNARRLALSLDDAAGPAEASDDLLEPVRIHALHVHVPAEVRGHKDREDPDVLGPRPRVDRIGDRPLMPDGRLHREDRLAGAEAQRLRVEGSRISLGNRVHHDVQAVPVPGAFRAGDRERDLALAVRDEHELLLGDFREGHVPDLVLDPVELHGPLRRIGQFGMVDEIDLEPDRVVLRPGVRHRHREFLRLSGGEADLLLLQVEADAGVARLWGLGLGFGLRLPFREFVEETYRFRSPGFRRARGRGRVRTA